MLSDLQQQLDSAQQLLTQQSMLQSQHRMAWPRPASPSRGNRGRLKLASQTLRVASRAWQHCRAMRCLAMELGFSIVT